MKSSTKKAYRIKILMFIFLINSLICKAQFIPDRGKNLYQIKDEKLDKVVTAIKKSIPKKYKDKFNNNLSYIQEPTLRDRVTELYNELKTQTKTELNFQTDWINKFVKSRNYYTHFGKMDKDVLSRNNLQELSNKVRTLIYVLIAKELGIKEKILTNEVYRLILH